MIFAHTVKSFVGIGLLSVFVDGSDGNDCGVATENTQLQRPVREFFTQSGVI